MKKQILAVLCLAAALFAVGCELEANTDSTSVTVTDGTVSSFQTKQDNIVITAPGNSSNTILQR